MSSMLRNLFSKPYQTVSPARRSGAENHVQSCRMP